MKIIQLLPTLNFGDAVGNDAVALQRTLVRMGYPSKIYGDDMAPRYLKSGVADYLYNMPALEPEDIVLYHLAVSSYLHAVIPNWNCRMIAIYHNVTPPKFFLGYSEISFNITQNAYDELAHLQPVFEYILADSAYNKQDLLAMGYTCPIDVLPILIPFEDYRRQPALSILRRYRDGRTNLLFVGRLAPNKKQEDVIAAYAAYKKNFDHNARLILVGSSDDTGRYEKSLHLYVERLGLSAEDVVFSGHISFEEILGFYAVADLFLCMSEHEGFCVPLIEAMLFNVPIVAYSSSAIPETLGSAGLLLHSKNPELAACAIYRVLTDPFLRRHLQEQGKLRLADFSTEVVSKRFEMLLNAFVEKKL